MILINLTVSPFMLFNTVSVLTEAVLCGDPGSPGGGYREGNIFSYRSVLTYSISDDFYTVTNKLQKDV